MQWNAQPGSVYQVEETSDLTNPPPIVWSDVGAPVVGPANSLTVTNPASYLRRFYRIRLPDICP